jgi:hypothetical protein
MIENLYDSVLSFTNQSGYIDKILELPDSKSLLRWSSNNMFPYNNGNSICNIHNPNYPTIVFSHDEFFRVPFSALIKEDGTIHNNDIFISDGN